MSKFKGTVMKEVISISHIDLDGFACSYLVNKFIEDNEVTNVSYLNVNYHELQDTLERVLVNIHTGPVDYNPEIIITDLNLNIECIELLELYATSVSQLTLIDHHKNDSVRLMQMQMELESNGANVLIVVEQGTSATQLFYNELTAGHGGGVENMRDIVMLINAWDVHDFSVEAAFIGGQLVNDVFNTAKSIFEPALSADVYNFVMRSFVKATVNVLSTDLPKFVLNSTFGGGKELESNLLTKLPDMLLELIDDTFTIDEDQYDLIKSVVFSLGSTQAFSVLAAYLSDKGDSIKTVRHEVEEHEDYVVGVPNQVLPMSVIHHLLYTLKTYNAICSIDTNSMTGRLRQRTGSYPVVDLSKIAAKWNGGGHTNAGGFTIKSKHPWDLVELRKCLLKEFETTLERPILEEI
jgi:oligoribonuclease NrnB/cAMP/cGMP phosphodiesterase (DHH superfamily)